MRVSTRPALQRILAIDLAVRRRDWPNARILARELEVVRRTIQRDIRFLRTRLCAPLKFDRGGRCHALSDTQETWAALSVAAFAIRHLPSGICHPPFLIPHSAFRAPDDDWCLIGHCHMRNAIRLFKVQRVRAVEETGECFRRPAGFKAKEFMAESFGTIRGDGDFQVVLRFTQAYAGIIREKDWHPGQVLEPQPDGTLILRLHVNDLRRIKRWVMYLGAECNVPRTSTQAERVRTHSL